MDPNGDGGMKTGHTDSAGHGMRTGQEGIYTGRAHGNRGKDRDMSGTTRGIIDIRVDARKNTTKDLEMSPMWHE